VKALIADDDASSRLLLQKVLTKWGYEVVTADGGEQALELLTADDPPGIAVLDWMMPDLDGVDVCRRVRAREATNPPYLILLTSRAEKHDVVTGLEAGANDYVQKPFDRDELRARMLVGRRFAELNSRLLETQRAFEKQALTDALTGTMNRRAVLNRLNAEAARAGREGSTLTVALMDIDHFKLVNDRHGHAAGDVVLKAVVDRSLNGMRPYDALGRFGGEEFLIILPGVGGADAGLVLERVRRAVCDSPVEVDGARVSVTVSIGGAVRAAESVDDLIRLADDALYRAKDEGRDRVVMAGRADEEGCYTRADNR